MSKINSEQILGGGSSGGPIVVNFDFITTSPLILQSVVVGELLYQSIIVILTPFNDPTATIQVGTTTDSDLLFSTGDIDPTIASQYNSSEAVLIENNDLLIMTIDLGASTTGSGTIYYWIT